VHRAHVHEAAVVLAVQGHALLRGGLVQGHKRVEEQLFVLRRQFPQLAPHVVARQLLRKKTTVGRWRRGGGCKGSCVVIYARRGGKKREKEREKEREREKSTPLRGKSACVCDSYGRIFLEFNLAY